MFILGCNTGKMIVDTMDPVVEKMDQSLNKSNDVEMARQAFPANLLLIEGLLESSPNNKRLLLAATQGYFFYAFAFIEEENKERAKKLYLKSRDYALDLFFDKKDDFKAALKNYNQEYFLSVLSQTDHEDVPALFWMVNSWMAWINLNLDNLDIFVDLPKIEALMNRLLLLDDSYFYGGIHLCLASYYGILSKALGGQPEKSKYHFEKAFSGSRGKLLLVHFFYAKYYAVQIQDKKLFIKTLEDILAIPDNYFPERNLLNQVIKIKAKKLLKRVEEYF